MSLRIESPAFVLEDNRVPRNRGNILLSASFASEPAPASFFVDDHSLNQVAATSLAYRNLSEFGRKKRKLHRLSEAQDLLANPVISKENILTRAQSLCLEFNMKSRSRFNTGLEDSFKAYSGSWYFQGRDGTCVPWSIANSLNVNAQRIDPVLMTRLLNAAIGDPQISQKTSEEKHGLHYDKAAAIIAQSPNKTFDLELLPYNFKIPKHLNTVNAITFNAKITKNLLDRGQPIVSLVKPYIVFDSLKKVVHITHSVCLAGYRVQNGLMDLQLVDSLFGIYWISIEHFSDALTLNRRLRIAKVNEAVKEEKRIIITDH